MSGKLIDTGAIEKGANDGQTEYVKSIVAALKSAVTMKPPLKGPAKKGKRKGKREVYDAEDANAQREAVVAAVEQRPSDWGLFEPLHAILGPIIDIARPFLTSQVIIAVLFVLLAYNWLIPSRSRTGVGFLGYAPPERIAAYEEIWRREESALWDWLEDRVGIDGVYAPALGKDGWGERQKVLNARSMGKQLDGERMTERQIDDAIRTTEERLAALKEAVKRKKKKHSQEA